MYLEKINSPSDIKSYSLDEMKELAKEMRAALLKKLSIHGGHCGPNFGMVEATIALHYVFKNRNRARMAIGLRMVAVRGEPSCRMPFALGCASG